MRELIRLEQITKQYGEKIVLKEITQTFYQGQSVAFVGHNGCGKSTMLKIIAQLIGVTKGKVTYEKNLLFHYVPERFPLVALTGRQYLHSMGTMDGLKEIEIGNQIEKLGHDFFLDELLDLPMKSMSKGTLQKIGVIQALLRKPDVLLLDEPLSGQDRESKKVFIEKINQLREDEMTIFMSCHEKKLLDAVAQDVYTIENGCLRPCEYQEDKQYQVILENVAEREPMEEMQIFGKNYRLLLSEAECDKVLPELIQEGWRLRGMQNAQDD